MCVPFERFAFAWLPLPLEWFPLECAPFEVAAPFREPLCLPLLWPPLPVPPGVQRTPEPCRRPLPFEGRASRLGRRVGRLPAEACPGLRSRVCAAGRPKCGLAAAGLLLETGLRVAGILGA